MSETATVDRSLFDQLSAEQQDCFCAVYDWWKNTDEPYYVVSGLAGTGKSYTLAALAQILGLPAITPTAKAASVLTRKGVPATTLHSAFFQFAGSEQRENARGIKRFRTLSTGIHHSIFTEDLAAAENEKLFFERRDGAAQTVLLDEYSMVGEFTAKRLLSGGTRVIAFGDYGQLQPVEDKPFFTKPNFMLKEIHRQARDNPIIRQAWAIRHGRGYEPDGPHFQVKAKPTPEDALWADVVICWRRATRDVLTDKLRQHHGFRDMAPQPGEPVICLKNDYRSNIFNGQIGKLVEPFAPGDSSIILEIDGAIKTVDDMTFRGMPFPQRRGFVPKTEFDFGYAITCHKAQGSEWDNVVVVDEMPANYAEYNSWMYTGATRAAKNCMVVPMCR